MSITFNYFLPYNVKLFSTLLKFFMLQSRILPTSAVFRYHHNIFSCEQCPDPCASKRCQNGGLCSLDGRCQPYCNCKIQWLMSVVEDKRLVSYTKSAYYSGTVQGRSKNSQYSFTGSKVCFELRYRSFVKRFHLLLIIHPVPVLLRFSAHHTKPTTLFGDAVFLTIILKLLNLAGLNTGHIGERCQFPRTCNPCQQQPCRNGATCQSDGRSF